ncbi:uncharacterized protein N7515_010069 [Penicillium bovifimosum]|uniref:Uncharacterized protein n=1 Tax=Penicillium bovifimosum TaxID=126998 RepID=A0A9W9KTT9_9EURO|nr:uncharacterized protein N7515_010069 [Penicillium bovifimosum]KAJ5120681.1 hypothetical protein N7515_010069 [Penicillium bovifimosum]
MEAWPPKGYTGPPVQYQPRKLATQHAYCADIPEEEVNEEWNRYHAECDAYMAQFSDSQHTQSDDVAEDPEAIETTETVAQTCVPADWITTCLRCGEGFTSNNKLHQHLLDCKVSAAAAPDQETVANFAQTQANVPIVESDRKGHDRDLPLAFRSWKYASALVAIQDPHSAITVCLDSGCVMTLIDAALARSLQVPIVPNKPIAFKGIG